MEEGAPNPALSRVKAVTASQEAATTLLQAAEVAAASLGQQEVDQGLTATDILKDQSSRTTASRWRAGTAPRRITAALARLVNSLSWASSDQGGGRAGAPPPVRARPVLGQPAAEPPATAEAWFRPWVWPRPEWQKWTLLTLIFVVLFPRLTALCVSLVLRLVLRASLAVVSQLFRELCAQILEVTGNVEAQLVQVLSAQFGMEPFGQPLVVAPRELPQAHYQPPPVQQPHPTRPMDLVTLVLVALQLRQAPGLGWVGERG